MTRPGARGVGADNDRWVLPAGTASDQGWDVVVDDRIEGWAHTRLHVATLGVGERRRVELGDTEVVVVPLAGAVRVEVVDAAGGEHTLTLPGRESVFAGPTDVAYVPRGSTLTVAAVGYAACRVALAGAVVPAEGEPKPVRVVTAGEVPPELRGAGACSREVRAFGLPEALDAQAVLVCEVITPAGNWSSYPPHKHDTDRPGVESALEEIYLFETQPAAGLPTQGSDPVGYQQVYSASEERPIDVLAEVRTGDVVLVPYGWHGPAVAAPDADLYYLNVMAGPGAERAWLICDDPAHAHVRDGWATQAPDPRLPMGGPR